MLSHCSRIRPPAGLLALILSVVPTLAMSLASPAVAQSGGWSLDAPSAGPGWLPRRVALIETHPFTPAEKAEVRAVYDAIEAVLRRVPVLARPDGFELEPLFVQQGELVPPRDRLYTYQYRLLIWKPKKEERAEPLTRVIVTVNPDPAFLLEVPGRGPFGVYGDGESGEIFYWAPHVTGTLPGGGLLLDGLDYPSPGFVQGLYIAGDEPPYLPVSRERVLRAELAGYEQEGAAMEALGAVPSASVGMRQQLEKMSPAELAQQACFDLTAMWKNEGVEGGLKLAFIPPAPGADCLVVGNRTFYEARGNPVTPRIIGVWLQVDGGHDRTDAEFRDTTVVKVFETLDWAALGILAKTGRE